LRIEASKNLHGPAWVPVPACSFQPIPVASRPLARPTTLYFRSCHRDASRAPARDSRHGHVLRRMCAWPKSLPAQAIACGRFRRCSAVGAFLASENSPARNCRCGLVALANKPGRRWSYPASKKARRAVCARFLRVADGHAANSPHAFAKRHSSRAVNSSTCQFPARVREAASRTRTERSRSPVPCPRRQARAARRGGLGP